MAEDFSVGDRVTAVSDPRATGDIIKLAENTVLVRWEIATNPYGRGAPRLYWEKRSDIRLDGPECCTGHGG